MRHAHGIRDTKIDRDAFLGKDDLLHVQVCDLQSPCPTCKEASIVLAQTISHAFLSLKSYDVGCVTKGDAKH